MNTKQICLERGLKRRGIKNHSANSFSPGGLQVKNEFLKAGIRLNACFLLEKHSRYGMFFVLYE